MQDLRRNVLPKGVFFVARIWYAGSSIGRSERLNMFFFNLGKQTNLLMRQVQYKPHKSTRVLGYLYIECFLKNQPENVLKVFLFLNDQLKGIFHRDEN